MAGDRSRRRAIALVAVSIAFAGCTGSVADDPVIPSDSVVSSSAPASVEEALGCDLAIGANIDWAGWTGDTEKEALDALLADFPDVNSARPWGGPTPYGMGSLWLLYADDGVGYGTAVTIQQELDADGDAGWIATIDRLCDSQRN